MIIKPNNENKITCNEFNNKYNEFNEQWYNLIQKDVFKWKMFYELEKKWKVLGVFWEEKYEFGGKWYDHVWFFVELTLYVFKNNDWHDYILINQYIVDGDEDMGDESVMKDCYYYIV